MRADTDTIDEFVASDYKYGFVTDIESESIKPGLGEGRLELGVGEGPPGVEVLPDGAPEQERFLRDYA